MCKYKLIEKKNSNIDVIKLTLVCTTDKGSDVVGVDYFYKIDFDEWILKEVINLNENYSGENQLLEYPNDAELPIPGEYSRAWEQKCHTLKELIIEYVGENGKVYDVILN